MKPFSKLSVLIAGLYITTTLPTFAHTANDLSQAANDSVITAKIKSQLAVEQVTSAKDISVETNNGVVILKGVTASDTEAGKAVEIAESTKGVQKVDAENLTVANSSQPLKDIYLAARIRGKLIKYNLTTPKTKQVPVVKVKVEVREGVANLSGTVKYDWQITKLTELAKSVEGISQVNSTLTVKK